MGGQDEAGSRNSTSSRRAFIARAAKGAAVAGLASVVSAPGALAGEGHDELGHGRRLLPKDRIGIQLFTVRDKVNLNTGVGFDAVFAELARIGYREIEFAGYTEGGGRPSRVPELRAMLKRHGLRGVGSHVGAAQFRTNLTQVLDDAETIGLPFIGTANAPDAILAPDDPTPRNTTESYQRAAEQFNLIGAACKARGMRFYQHNHDGEFRVDPTTGIRLYDTILAETDPRLVFFQLDIYWAYVGQFRFGGGYDGPGFDPIELVRARPLRFPLFHVKDGVRAAVTNGYQFTDVGAGVLPFEAFFVAIRRTVDAGYHHFIVERDDAPSLLPNPPGSFGSAERSYEGARDLRADRRHHRH